MCSRRKNSHVTVIRLGSNQEGQPEISSKVEVDKTPKVENVSVVVASNPEPTTFKLPPPPTSQASVSGIPLLPPPPGPTKSRTSGNNHQVLVGLLLVFFQVVVFYICESLSYVMARVSFKYKFLHAT